MSSQPETSIVLAGGKALTPFRGSKLPLIVKDSLTDIRICTIANASPARSERISTSLLELTKKKASIFVEQFTSQAPSLNLPPEFYSLKQEAPSSDVQILSMLKREHQQPQRAPSQIGELDESSMQKLIDSIFSDQRMTAHEAALQAEIADLKKLKLEYQNERKTILGEKNAETATVPSHNNHKDKEIQVIDLEEPAPSAEKILMMPNEMISQLQEVVSKMEAQTEKQASQPRNEMGEAVKVLREEYAARIKALESDLLQQKLIACDKSAEVVNKEIRYKNLERKLDMQIQSSLDQRNLWEKSLKEYESYWTREIEQKNQQFSDLVKKNEEIALDLQIKSSHIKSLQVFKEKYIKLEKISTEQEKRQKEALCQYQRKLEDYTKRLLERNLEVTNLRKELYYLTQDVQGKMASMKELEERKGARAKNQEESQKDEVLRKTMESMLIKYREILKEKNAEIKQKNLQLSELQSAWEKLDEEKQEKVNYKEELETMKNNYEKLEKSSQATRTLLESKLQKYEESWRNWLEDKKKKKYQIVKLKKENSQLSQDLQKKSDYFEKFSKNHDKMRRKKKAYKLNYKELLAKVDSLEQTQKNAEIKTEFLTEISKNTLKMFGKFEEWIFSTLSLKALISQGHKIDALKTLFTSLKGQLGRFINGDGLSIELSVNPELSHIQESLSRKEELEGGFEKFIEDFGNQLQEFQQDALLCTPSLDSSDKISTHSNDHVSEPEGESYFRVVRFSSSVSKETERHFDKVTLPLKLDKLRNSKPQDSPWAGFLFSPSDNKVNEFVNVSSSPAFYKSARVVGSPIDPQILTGKRSYEDMRSLNTPEKRNQEQRSFGVSALDSLNVPLGCISRSSGHRKMGASSVGSEIKKKLKLN